MIELLRGKQEEVALLCQKYGVRRLDVFGSAARGGFEPGKSDLDFIADFSNRGPGYADRFYDLAEELESLFGVPVDLLTEKPIENPYFRAAVEESRETLYAA